MPLAIIIDDITVVDYARLDAETVVRGDSLVISAELRGDVQPSGFVMDFGKVKPLIKSTIDRALDHRLLVATRDDALQVSHADDCTCVRYRGLVYEAPSIAVAELQSDSITPESVARAIEALVKPVLPANVTGVQIEARHAVRDASTAFAYTHGLPHHDGNCQRLLHGHRGFFDVTWDGRDDRELAQWLARTFDGAHFAHVRDARDGGVTYTAPQGRFSATLPAERVVAINNEPSIEHVVAHAFDTLAEAKHLDPTRLAVRANEGPRNGARFSG